ncbi:PsiF family protein [Azohydromonas aeria]|uniref:PsiF family protein n=1 Tax=Azohydromonas aeria TaxID=2590212 RepID=UPI0012FA3188|nr:PsiF family protein [Azohydromonas aeria]
MTKSLLAWLLAACAFAAHAAEPAAADKPADKPAKAPTAPTAQQAKMKTCNATAKSEGKKGDERKAFMKECLSKKA